MRSRPVAIVGYGGAELLDIACVTTSLGIANATGNVRTPYQVTVVSPGQRVRLSPHDPVMSTGDAVREIVGSSSRAG